MDVDLLRFRFLFSSTLCQDIRTIKHLEALVEEPGISRIDFIIGGPSCQGFSRLRW
jgi:site-specific DNA-cytosine methylase